MSTLIDFTSYASIRAVLGVSDDELEDVTLALPGYMQLLKLEFDSISPNIESLYLPLVVVPTPAMTPTEQRFVDLVQLFAAYSTAKTLLASLPLFAPKSISDGRAKLDRFPDPLDVVKGGVESLYVAIRAKLVAVLDELGQVTPVSPVITFFSTAPLGYNPVTNV